MDNYPSSFITTSVIVNQWRNLTVDKVKRGMSRAWQAWLKLVRAHYKHARAQENKKWGGRKTDFTHPTVGGEIKKAVPGSVLLDRNTGTVTSK